MGYIRCMSDKKRIIYVCDLYQVLQVISVNKDEQFKIDQAEFEPYQLIEFLGEFENEIKKPGDLLPLELNRCRFLKQMGEIICTPRERFDFKNLQIKNQEMFQNFATNFSIELIKDLRQQYSGLAEDREVAYRCFYNSFKMYRLRDYVIEMSQILMSLATQKPQIYTYNQDLMTHFKELGFDDVLEKSLEKILATNFCMNRNDSQAWFEDSQVLFSSYYLFSKACDYFLTFCEKLDQGTNIVQQNRNILDWDEAGAMTVWSGISFLRTIDVKSPQGQEQLKRFLKPNE